MLESLISLTKTNMFIMSQKFNYDTLSYSNYNNIICIQIFLELQQLRVGRKAFIYFFNQ
jgi:hypothetical protein